MSYSAIKQWWSKWGIVDVFAMLVGFGGIVSYIYVRNFIPNFNTPWFDIWTNLSTEIVGVWISLRVIETIISKSQKFNKSRNTIINDLKSFKTNLRGLLPNMYVFNLDSLSDALDDSTEFIDTNKSYFKSTELKSYRDFIHDIRSLLKDSDLYLSKFENVKSRIDSLSSIRRIIDKKAIKVVDKIEKIVCEEVDSTIDDSRVKILFDERKRLAKSILFDKKSLFTSKLLLGIVEELDSFEGSKYSNFISLGRYQLHGGTRVSDDLDPIDKFIELSIEKLENLRRIDNREVILSHIDKSISIMNEADVPLDFKKYKLELYGYISDLFECRFRIEDSLKDLIEKSMMIREDIEEETERFY